MDLVNGTIDVVDNWQDQEADPLKPPKWWHEKFDVPLPGAVVAELSALRGERTGLVFCDVFDNSVPIHNQYLFQSLRAAGAGCDPVITVNRKLGFHSLRHSFVSVGDVRAQEERRAALRDVAGHNDDATQALYRHKLQSESERVAGEWDSFLIENGLTIAHVADNHEGLFLYKKEPIAVYASSLRAKGLLRKAQA